MSCPHNSQRGVPRENANTTTLNGPRPDVVTLDCYGTLIDWETGIRNAFRRALGNGASEKLADRIFQVYDEEERRIEAKAYRPYRRVLSEAMLAAAKKGGLEFSKEESGFLATDLPTWKPFPDTNPALSRLSKKYSLGILSNIDNDLLAGTLKHLSGFCQVFGCSVVSILWLD